MTDETPEDPYADLYQIRPRLAQPSWVRLIGFTAAKEKPGVEPSTSAKRAIRRNDRKDGRMRLIRAIFGDRTEKP